MNRNKAPFGVLFLCKKEVTQCTDEYHHSTLTACFFNEFVFQIFNQLSEKTIEMDDDGNVTITGVFATGTDKNARTVIDKNGIQSYDADGQRDGLWS